MKKVWFVLLVLFFATSVFAGEEAKVSTQRTFTVGQFVDVGDGFTPETVVTLDAMDEKVLCPPNGATPQTLNDNDNSWTAKANADGHYNILIVGDSLATYGRYTLVLGDDDVFLPLSFDIDVINSSYWDYKYGSSSLDVNVDSYSSAAKTTLEVVNSNTIIGYELDHLIAVAESDDPADDSIVAKLMSTDGDWSAASNSTDSLQSIRDAITATSPLEYNPDSSSVITTGTETSGTYASCANDDATDWFITSADGAYTVDVICEFNLDDGRRATGLEVNGFFDENGAGTDVCEIYGYDYVQDDWVKVSGSTAATEMRNRSSDTTYTFSLGAQYTDPSTSVGEVKIRFRSTETTTATGDILYLDHVFVTGESEGAASPDVIAKAVHAELDPYLEYDPLFTGRVRYVSRASTSSDDNEGEFPTAAFLTIGAAVAASAEGDYIKVGDGEYDEAVDLNLDGLELHGEIGAEIKGGGGVPLTISANHCRASWLELAPDAGQIGMVVSGYENFFEHITVHEGGLTGIQIGSTNNKLEKCIVGGYSSIGIEVRSNNNVLSECLARGSGAVTGYNLTNSATGNLLNVCATIGNDTASYDIDAGANENLLNTCSEGRGEGSRVDQGTNNAWQNFGSYIYGMSTGEVIGSIAAKTVGPKKRTVNTTDDWDLFYYGLDDLDPPAAGTEVLKYEQVDSNGQTLGTITITDPY